MGFSRQEYWSGLPFPFPADHFLSELTTVSHPSWVALHSMACSSTELDKAVNHVISLVTFCDFGFHSISPLIDKDKRLLEASWWERLRGKLGLVLMDRTMLRKSLVQFSVDGLGCVPLLLFDLRPNYGGGNEQNGDLLHKVPCTHSALSAPNPAAGHSWPMPLPETPRHSWASLGQPLVGSLFLSPRSWCTEGFVCALQESVSQFCVSSGGSMVGLMATSSKRA